MESTTNFSSQVPEKAIVVAVVRLGPLHTCAAAVLTTTHKAYRVAEVLPGPVGFLSRKLDNLIGPLLFVLQCQWLAILSFVDDQILTVENVIEYIIPQCGYIFDKIDDLVHVADSLPDRFDNVVDNISTRLREMWYLKWALAQLQLVLNILITILSDWEVHEKEITIDINSHGEMSNLSTTTNDSSFQGGCDFDDEDEYLKDIAKKLQTDEIDKTNILTEMKKEEKNNEVISRKDCDTYYKEVECENKKEKENSENGKEKSINEKCVVSVKEKGSEVVPEDDPVRKLFSSAGWYDM